jgi:hypothetical protein
MENIVAVTKSDGYRYYPAYISINRIDYGKGVSITVRGPEIQFEQDGDPIEVKSGYQVSLHLSEEEWNSFIDQISSKTGL